MFASDLQKWRTIILVSMFVGYSSYYVSRKTFPYVMPFYLDKPDSTTGIALSKSQFGFTTSAFFIAYAASKICAGYLSDRIGAKVLFSSGLAASGVINLLIMAFATSPAVLCVLWTANGFVQGFGWPPCAQLMYAWFKPSETGTVWSVLTVACTLTPSFLPMLFTHIVAHYSWQACFLFAGIWSLGISMLLLPVIHNRPSDVNLVDVHTRNKSTQKQSGVDVGLLQAFVLVFRQPLIGSLASACLLSGFARMGLENWVQLFTVEHLNGTQHDASLAVSTFQIGGTIGSLVAGIASDKLLQLHQTNNLGVPNPRIPVTIAFTALMLIAFCGCHLASNMVLLYMCCGLAGFSSYGPHALYGLLVSESAVDGLRGTALSAISVSGLVGVFFAGYPLSIVLTTWGWTAHFVVLEIAVLISLCLVVRSCFVGIATPSKLD